MSGAQLLGHYPHETVRVFCTKCDRTALRSHADLVREYGPDYRLPDLRHDLTPDCGRKNPFLADYCGTYYPSTSIPILIDKIVER